MAVFGLAHAGFQGTQAAQLTLHAHADGMGHIHHFLGHRHVVSLPWRQMDGWKGGVAKFLGKIFGQSTMSVRLI